MPRPRGVRAGYGFSTGRASLSWAISVWAKAGQTQVAQDFLWVNATRPVSTQPRYAGHAQSAFLPKISGRRVMLPGKSLPVITSMPQDHLPRRFADNGTTWNLGKPHLVLVVTLASLSPRESSVRILGPHDGSAHHQQQDETAHQGYGTADHEQHRVAP